MKTKIIYTLVSIVLCVFVFIMGRVTAPEKIQTKTVVDEMAVSRAIEEERARIITSLEQTKTRDITKDSKGILHIHEETLTKNKTQEVKHTELVGNTSLQTHEETQTHLTKPSFSLELFATKSYPNLLREPLNEGLSYGVNLSYRILGDFWMGVYANTEKEFGLSARLDF